MKMLNSIIYCCHESKFTHLTLQSIILTLCATLVEGVIIWSFLCSKPNDKKKKHGHGTRKNQDFCSLIERNSSEGNLDNVMGAMNKEMPILKYQQPTTFRRNLETHYVLRF